MFDFVAKYVANVVAMQIITLTEDNKQNLEYLINPSKIQHYKKIKKYYTLNILHALLQKLSI